MRFRVVERSRTRLEFAMTVSLRNSGAETIGSHLLLVLRRTPGRDPVRFVHSDSLLSKLPERESRQIHHAKVPPAFLVMRFDVQEVRPVQRQDEFDSGRDVAVPVDRDSDPGARLSRSIFGLAEAVTGEAGRRHLATGRTRQRSPFA